MIPKVIHYCWFGQNSLPAEYKEYMQSWKKYCPDYEIVEWNEDNFDVTENMYCLEAYQAGKWAFVSDYARLKIIYDNGGVYLDTDVELLKDITPLIADGVGFIGFQNPIEATTGLGFAASSHNRCVKAMLDIYKNRHFLFIDGKKKTIPCPAANTVGLIGCGLRVGNPWCNGIQMLQGIRVYPESYFNPLNRDTQELKITPNTYMIHHYAATWLGENHDKKKKIKRLFPKKFLNKRTERIARRDIVLIMRELESGGKNTEKDRI